MEKPGSQTESLDVKPNIKPLSEWSDEELRLKVAELCGDLNQPTTKPTIAELEAILNSSDKLSINILPNGEVRAFRDYAADLNAALELCGLLADKGWTVQIDSGLDKTWECTFEAGISGHKDFKQRYATADKLPRAICEAFVATLTDTPNTAVRA